MDVSYSTKPSQYGFDHIYYKSHAGAVLMDSAGKPFTSVKGDENYAAWRFY